MGNTFAQLIDETDSCAKEWLELYGKKISKRQIKNYIGVLAEKVPDLNTIIVGDCRIKVLPNDINSFSKLITLDLHNNLLLTLPQMNSLSNLKTLNLSRNSFSKYPEEISGLTTLENLNLSGNSIKIHPGLLTGLSNLKVLNISDNAFEEFPDTILQLHLLESLDISKNKINNIPDSLSSLSNLQNLNASYNTVESVGIVTSLVQLRVLNLSGNKLGPLSGITFENMTNLIELDLSHCNIPSLPDPFCAGLCLKILRLNGNRILQLSDMSSLRGLVELHLQDNQLVKLSKSLLRCKNLEKLHCEFNNLMKLPANLSSLSRLRYLTLHYNKFRVVPESLRETQFINNLHIISLEDNQFPEDVRRSIHNDGTKMFLSTREEDPEKSKKSYRPSLSRLASQYGTLRGRPAPMHPSLYFADIDSDSATISPSSPQLQKQSRLSPKIPDFNRKSPDRRRHLTVEKPTKKDADSLNSETDKKSKTARFHDSRRGSFRTLRGMDKSEPTSEKKSRKGSFNPHTSTKPSTQGLSEFLEKHSNYSMPLYGKFKESFENLLDEIGIRDSLKEELKSYAVENRWRLLKIYRQDLIKLLGITNSDEDRDKTAEDMLKSINMPDYATALSHIISRLKAKNISNSLRLAIKEFIMFAPLKWIYYFICNGGIDHISAILQSILAKKDKDFYDSDEEKNYAESLLMLTHASADTFIFSKIAMDVLVTSLTSDQISTKHLGIQSLNNLLKTNNAALYAILNSLDRLRIILGKSSRFSIIIEFLQRTKSTIERKIKVFSLVCSIVSAEKDLLNRFLLRKELLALGLKDFLNNFANQTETNDINQSDLIYMIKDFNRTTHTDSEEVNALIATDYRVLQRVKDFEEQFTELSKSLEIDAGKFSPSKPRQGNELSSVKEDYLKKKRPHSINLGSDKSHLKRSTSMKTLKSYRKSEEIDFNAKRLSQKSIRKKLTSPLHETTEKPLDKEIQGTLRIIISDFGSTSLRYDESTTVAQIIQKILNKYPIDHPDYFGLMLLSAGSDKHEGFWVTSFEKKVFELVDKFGDVGCMGSYKMKPWRLPIECIFQDKQFIEDLEPNWTVGQAVAFIATKCRLPLDQEYELYVRMTHHQESGMGIMKSHTLIDSQTLMCILSEPFNLTVDQLTLGEECILELGYKPVSTKVIISPNIIQYDKNDRVLSANGEDYIVVVLDYRYTEKDVLAKIAEKLSEISDINDYCLMFESKKTSKKRFTSPNKNRRKSMTVITSSSEIQQVRFYSGNLYQNFFDHKKTILKLSIVPRDVYILLPNSEEIRITIMFSEYVSDLINIAVSSLDEDETGTNYYSLYYNSTLLSRRKTLIEAGIGHGYHLTLKKENFTESMPTRNRADSISKSDGEATSESVDLTSSNSEIPFDINIYDEKGGDEYIVYEDKENGIISAASFNKIVEKLTDPNDYDDAFLETFLFTYRSFATQEQLLHKIIQRYNPPASITDEKADTIRVRVCIFLTRWMDRHYNEMNDRILEKVNIWIENEISDEKRREILLKTLNKVKAKRVQKSITVEPITLTISDNRLISKTSVSLLDLDDEEISRQLTLDLWNIYSQLKPTEFFDMSWTKDKGKSQNLSMMIERFNVISSWIATEICTEQRLKYRRNKLKRFIKIAVHLKDLKNFHLLYAFVSALSSNPVSRLKFTFDKLGRQYRQILNELENFVSMDGSFKVYRESLKSIKNTACIPYIAVLLKDLTFIEDGNPNTIDGLINWSKRKLFFDVVGSYLKYSLVGFSAAPVIVNGVHITDILQSLPTLEEPELYELSIQAEPRGAKSESIK